MSHITRQTLPELNPINARFTVYILDLRSLRMRRSVVMRFKKPHDVGYNVTDVTVDKELYLRGFCV